jgi:MFS family permease
MFLMFASNATGVNGTTNFMIPIAVTLGYTGDWSLIIYAIYTSIGTFFVLVACFTVDHFGRRRMFLIGFPAMGVCLLIEAMLQMKFLGSGNAAGNKAAIAFMNIFIVLFQLVDSPSFIYSAEIMPTTIRAKGMGLAIFAYMAGYVTFSAPGGLAFANIKWRYYLIFMAFSFFSTIVVYFWFPETKGIPIEEIGELFGDKVVAHLTEDGHGIVEESEDINETVVEKLNEKV